MFALARDGMTKEARELLESREDVDVNASVASLTPLRTASEVRFTIFFFFFEERVYTKRENREVIRKWFVCC